jgi:adhesin transport system membrane fusion protein
MLNISHQSVSGSVSKMKYSTLVAVEQKMSKNVALKIMYVTFGLLLIMLFLPWTQNIRSRGSISTLRPNERPQHLNSVIGGQIDAWYVQEGDFVKKGDTILRISEVKDEYFDPQLLERTQEQVDLKELSIDTYIDKIKTQDEQLAVLNAQRDLKLKQSRIKYNQSQLKVQSDSIAYAAALINKETALLQFNRTDSLQKRGLKSLTDLEVRNLKLQEAKSYELEAKNKWLNSKTELINLQLEISNVQVDYETYYNKMLSDKFSTISVKLDSESSLSKLKNQYSNYAYRQGLYYILAPQDGYITSLISNGIGETIKEGEEILTLVPANFDFAAEIFVDPIDLPLLQVNEKVRLQFDGWPAIVFSGWPNISHGTYGGEIYAIDRYISQNGKYRVLVKPDPNDHPWPEALRFGSGVSSMILLKDVPIWYELWRKINGFPPDYYKNEEPKPEKK